MKLQILAVAIAMPLTLASCGETTTDAFKGSGLGDIYKADNNPERRHKATPEELLWTVNVKGCSGAMLTPTYVLTASHCNPKVGDTYRSGSSIAKGQEEHDIEVIEMTERVPKFDYAVLKVKWLNAEGKMPADQKLPKSILTKQSDAKFSGKIGEGDEVFTVGFPADKTKEWFSTFAKGRLKTFWGVYSKYNIGTINGNSGGSVWRISDLKLITMTNGGSHYIGQPGWDNNELDDSGAWNFGPNMENVYKQSTILKQIFPGGMNRYYQGD